MTSSVATSICSESALQGTVKIAEMLTTLYPFSFQFGKSIYAECSIYDVKGFPVDTIFFTINKQFEINYALCQIVPHGKMTSMSVSTILYFDTPLLSDGVFKVCGSLTEEYQVLADVFKLPVICSRKKQYIIHSDVASYSRDEQNGTMVITSHQLDYPNCFVQIASSPPSYLMLLLHRNASILARLQTIVSDQMIRVRICSENYRCSVQTILSAVQSSSSEIKRIIVPENHRILSYIRHLLIKFSLAQELDLEGVAVHILVIICNYDTAGLRSGLQAVVLGLNLPELRPLFVQSCENALEAGNAYLFGHICRLRHVTTLLSKHAPSMFSAKQIMVLAQGVSVFLKGLKKFANLTKSVLEITAGLCTFLSAFDQLKLKFSEDRGVFVIRRVLLYHPDNEAIFISCAQVLDIAAGRIEITKIMFERCKGVLQEIIFRGVRRFISSEPYIELACSILIKILQHGHECVQYMRQNVSMEMLEEIRNSHAKSALIEPLVNQIQMMLSQRNSHTTTSTNIEQERQLRRRGRSVRYDPSNGDLTRARAERSRTVLPTRNRSRSQSRRRSKTVQEVSKKGSAQT